MNQYKSNFYSLVRWTSILGSLLLLIQGGIYFFSVSAQPKLSKMPAVDNLIIGRLAFNSVSVPSPQNYLYTSNADGSERITLPTEPSTHPNHPTWSPDGTKIAYSAGQFPNDIFVINADGTGQTNLTNTEFSGFENNPSWSVTGKIAYVATTTHNSNDPKVWTMNEDGSGQAVFAGITQPTSADPAWSPDGSRLAFASEGEIWVINSDGTNELRVTFNSTNDRDPAWSPDGTKIVFVRQSAGLSVINADGTNETVLTNDSTHFQPAWSPDGTKIAFSSEGSGIFTMNADGTDQVRIIANTSQFPNCCDTGYRHPTWQPVDQTLTNFDISGQITDNGSPVDGVIVNLNGSIKASTTTDAKGNYQFLNVPAGGKYTVSPSKVRTYFSPTNHFYFSLLADKTANFELSEVCAVGQCATPFDYNGDGRADISVFRPSDGTWYVRGVTNPQMGLSTDVLVPADYDGDKKTDVAVWRPSNGNYYILNSFTSTLRIENLGIEGDIPTGGDWDGDGKADPAVYRDGAQGTFYYRGSMGNPQSNITSVFWGTTGDKAVVEDYDGDGLTDAAIYRNGVWYIRQSSDGQAVITQFGITDDVLVPADYDGDGKADLAVYRDGIWYLLQSTQGFTAFQFGLAGDIATPADYDGDGRTDAAIFRNAITWILKSQSGTTEAIRYGLSSDKPIASAYVR